MEDNLDRVWKHFGKNTNAGKLLYDLYGIRYKPEQHINYPDISKIKKYVNKADEKAEEIKRAKSSAQNRIQNIDYPDLRKKYTSKYSKVDFIPKRKNEFVIRQEMEIEKQQMIKNSQMKRNFPSNRKMEIEKLQDNFQFQERKVMPKGARLPGLKSENNANNTKSNLIEEYNDNNPIENEINVKNYRKYLDKKEELNFLYSTIMKEIDERYAHMDEMKKIGKNVDERIMNEIKDRLDELKSLKKMMSDLDK